MTLPFVFDIFWPSASRTMPCRYTTWNGTSPMHSMPSMIMRATQKKRMSKPVIRSEVGIERRQILGLIGPAEG